MESEKIVLNDDVLLDILARLPPESVMRFKSVSPQWRDLLSSPDFFRRHAAAHRDGGGGRLVALFQEAEPVRETWESAKGMTCNTLPICKKLMRENNIPKHVGRFVNSSNGLILCSRTRTRGSLISYHVGNPLTGKFVELPPPPEGRGRLLVKGLKICVGAPTLLSEALICEEEDNKNEAATYSVVRAGMVNRYLMERREDTKTLYIDSYSSNTGKWSPVVLEAISKSFYYLSERPAVVANGIVHWYAVFDHILVYNPKGINGNGGLKLIKVPQRKKCCAVTRMYDDVLWLGLMQKHNFKFYMLPKHYSMSEDDVVDAKKWVLMEEVSIFTLSRMMKKGLVACKHEETKLEYLFPQSECRSEVVAVLRQGEKVFLYNVQRKSLVKVDYSGHYNNKYRLHPYLQPSSLSLYSL